MPIIEMDNVESKIRTALEAIPARATAEAWQGETPWTIAVKTAIINIGLEEGWSTAPTKCKSEGREWLYDVVWYRKDAEGYMTDVPLVAESEWLPRDHIKEDFEKLLVSCAKYRVMIFQGSSKENVSETFKKMHLWISKFSRTAPGDRYFLAGWAKNHWLFDLSVL